MGHWAGGFPAVTPKLRQDSSLNLRAAQMSIERLIVSCSRGEGHERAQTALAGRRSVRT
jgi:hypothetical protein